MLLNPIEPGSGVRNVVPFEVVRQDRLACGGRAPRGSLAVGGVFSHGNFDAIEKANCLACTGRRYDPLALLIDQADPGQLEVPILDGNVAGRLEQLPSSRRTDDALVGAAERGVGVLQTKDLLLGCLLLGDVTK